MAATTIALLPLKLNRVSINGAIMLKKENEANTINPAFIPVGFLSALRLAVSCFSRASSMLASLIVYLESEGNNELASILQISKFTTIVYSLSRIFSCNRRDRCV